MKRHEWILLCRPGYERECSGEAVKLASSQGVAAESWYEKGSGWVSLVLTPGDDPVLGLLPLSGLVFARQSFLALSKVDSAEVMEAGGLNEKLAETGVKGKFVSALVEAADTDAGRAQLKRAAKLEPALKERLKVSEGPGRVRRGRRFHLFFPGDDSAYLGVSQADNSSSWASGIPRLKLPPGWPSRSAFKMEEAIHTFFGDRWDQYMKPGKKCVDLGAAPGGWSWQFARRGLIVYAVDHGAIDKEVLGTHLVEHVKADGYKYKPEKPVQWMVCDMVAAPARVASLMGLWATRGLCRNAIFNLKLPGNNRSAEIGRAVRIIRGKAREGGVEVKFHFKHLYHDRDEVTCWMEVGLPTPKPSEPKRGGGRRPGMKKGRRLGRRRAGKGGAKK